MLLRILQHYGICKHKALLQHNFRPLLFICLLFFVFYDVSNRYRYAVNIEIQDKNSLRQVFKYANENKSAKVAIVSMEFDDTVIPDKTDKTQNNSKSSKMSNPFKTPEPTASPKFSNFQPSDNPQTLSKITNFNKKVYSKLHSYDFIFYNSRLSGFYRPVWSKIKALQHVMNERAPSSPEKYYYEYILWMDSDAQILDFDVSSEQVYEKIFNVSRSSPDVVVACDSVGLNFGVAIFKNNQKTRDLLAKTLAQWWYQFHWQQEQSSFSVALEKAQTVEKVEHSVENSENVDTGLSKDDVISPSVKVAYLSRFFFNTYLNNRLFYSWIAHTPNCQSNCENYAKILQRANEAKYAGRHNLTVPLDYVFEKFLQNKIELPEKRISEFGIMDRFVKNKCSRNGF